jgi:hypothetical protein
MYISSILGFVKLIKSFVIPYVMIIKLIVGFIGIKEYYIFMIQLGNKLIHV